MTKKKMTKRERVILILSIVIILLTLIFGVLYGVVYGPIEMCITYSYCTVSSSK